MIKNILYISIFTVFAVTVWIGLNIYHGYTNTTVSKDVNIRVVPIDPSFDLETLNRLKERKSVPVSFTETIQQPQITPEKLLATGSALLQTVQNNQATQGASINSLTQL